MENIVPNSEQALFKNFFFFIKIVLNDLLKRENGEEEMILYMYFYIYF